VHVFDPMAGSGPVLLACEHAGRTCYAMEIEPRFCDVVVKRWENLTGQKAKRTNRDGSKKTPAKGRRGGGRKTRRKAR